MTSSKAPGLARFDRLPIVDISPLGCADAPLHEATVAALRQAASEVGFLYVVGHGVPESVIADLEQVAQSFFELPAPIKLRYHIRRSNNHRGYVPPGEEVFYGNVADTKEAFDVSREVEDQPEGPLHKFRGPNVWPDEVPEFAARVLRYYSAVFDLGERLLAGFAEALELPADYFAAHLGCPPSQLRLVHYPATPAGSATLGIGAHTDYECLTLLHTTGPGLEVKNAGGDWVEAPPIEGAFVVNIGDLLEVWSNGSFSSTWHRVRPVTHERYSFPLFFTVDYDTVVAPLEPLCREGARYEPLVAGDHLLAQTMQSFRYLEERRRQGLLALPERAHRLASFGNKRPG